MVFIEAFADDEQAIKHLRRNRIVRRDNTVAVEEQETIQLVVAVFRFAHHGADDGRLLVAQHERSEAFGVRTDEQRIAGRARSRDPARFALMTRQD